MSHELRWAAADLPWWSMAIGVALLAGCTAVLVGPLLRASHRHGESDREMPDFRRLAMPRFALAVGLTAAAAGLIVTGWAPMPSWPAWIGLITIGTLLGWIDAATMWLPLPPTHLLWLLTGLGVVATAAVPGPQPWWWPPLTAVLGAALLTGFFALVWWIGRGALGFGDVRLAVALGAATGACGMSTVLIAALIGTALAALWAVGRVVAARVGHRAAGGGDLFPYGPFLLLGAFLAPMVSGTL